MPLLTEKLHEVKVLFKNTIQVKVKSCDFKTYPVKMFFLLLFIRVENRRDKRYLGDAKTDTPISKLTHFMTTFSQQTFCNTKIVSSNMQ